MIETLQGYDWIEWAVLLFGLAYAIFSALNKSICWVFGILSCALLAYKDFTDYRLLFDGYLQIIYVLMGAIGLYRWMNPKQEQNLPIQHIRWYNHANGLLLTILLGVILGFLASSFFNPKYAIIDAITTIASIWATWLLVNKVYENWIYWIVIDIIYIWIFYRSGADLVAVLYGVYTLTAISGLILWARFKKSPAMDYSDTIKVPD